ncbi:MAG TPA: double-strand break repair protein AddB, partial [Beijerinckiaceae bacterium]|nr:double-strand break repair protein AddB [Beijerinckiaceae bacterium]
MNAAETVRARVFNVPPGVSFLPTFAARFLAGGVIAGFPGEGPLALAAATIYVPTRRAARALVAEFARLLPGPSALLPRIIPLGNLESLESDLLFEEPGLEDAHLVDVPEAASAIDRRLVLTCLILAWARQMRDAVAQIDANGEAVSDPDAVPLVAASPGHAWRLAGDLGSLIDEMIIEGVDWRLLEKIVPDSFDKYWRITLDFLKIAIALWPEYLRERNLVDSTERRASLIEAEVARLASLRSGAPVVAIGSTGTNKATAHLLAAIARSPSGAVVLPGLDKDLDENAWQLIAGGEGDRKFNGHDSGAGHPQAALRRLLGVLRVTREEVVDLAVLPPPIATRMRFLQEALRPADSTEHWRAYASTLDAPQLDCALEGISLIEADDERDEALALAIALREVLERPGATAALVTPDRQMARRVRAELARWDIDVDDSGG